MGSLFRFRISISVVGLLLAAQPVLADGKYDARTGGETNWANAGYAPNFQAFCEGDLQPAAYESFDADLAAAEQALAKGDLPKAKKYLGEAIAAVNRGGSDLHYPVALKCLGEVSTQRYFNANLDYYLKLQAKEGAKNIPVWVTAVEGGSQGIIKRVQGEKVNRYSRVYSECDERTRQLQFEREYGAFLLPEEQKVLNACSDVKIEIQKYARAFHDDAMAAEKVAFNRAPTEQERAIVADMSKMAAYMGGPTDAEVVLINQRVDESMNHLKDARAWNFGLGTDGGDVPRAHADLPESQRALQRGTTMMSNADDSAIDVLSRDKYYEMAIRYFDFGYQKNSAAKARTARNGIQADVERKQQQAQARQEELAIEMEGKLENVATAVEDMQKTEAEKKSFNDEADALEAELGF